MDQGCAKRVVERWNTVSEANTKLNELEAVKKLRDALDAKFAKDIVVLDLHEISPIADYFVIATGQSNPQLMSLQDTAEETLNNLGFELGHIEGQRSAAWILLDYGSIMVHLFDKESREYYNLEHIWGDAKIV